MIYDLAIVVDTGKYYTVTGTIKQDIDNVLNNENKYLKVSYNALEKIKSGLDSGFHVTIIKELTSDEVMPGEVFVNENQEPDLDIKKAIAVNKINKKLEYRSLIISSLDVLLFTTINNELMVEGYIITNSNREEQYIKIIETGDEVLINKLEKYLTILDNLEDIKLIQNICLNSFAKVKAAVSTEEIDVALSEFYSNIDVA